MTEVELKAQCRDRLKLLLEAITHSIAGEKQYHVPITYSNHHNGNDEHHHQNVWATSVVRAIDNATNGRNGRWCSVDGEVKIIAHTPEFTEGALKAILALPDPL